VRPVTFVLPLLNEDIGGKFSLGLILVISGPKIYYLQKAQADPIPTNFRLGFAYKVLDDELIVLSILWILANS